MSEGKKVRWTIASARQRLPALVGLAAREPQDIYRRDVLVARVVSPEHAPPQTPSMSDAIATLQRICVDERYSLETPARRDRPVRVPRERKGKKRG